MPTRREFLGTVAATAAATRLGAADAAPATAPAGLLWGNLLHLSFNMWCDRPVASWGPLKKEDVHFVTVAPHLRFDQTLWDDLTARMAKAGMNLVVIDLGDAVRYDGHPEIAVRNAWTPAKLRDELKRLRQLGLEPIPKLNFSTAHDQWLGHYSRMVATPTYYKVCEELIAEVCALFDAPRFFHLGYDEETIGNQAQYALAIVRQHELWWHDFRFFIAAVERHKARPWVWSDYAWAHGDSYYRDVPRSVLQSNWYYGLTFDPAKEKAVRAYVDLEQHGFDQLPTASNWSAPENFAATVAFARRHIDPARLKGFLQTPWMPTVEKFRAHHEAAIDLVAAAIRTGRPAP